MLLRDTCLSVFFPSPPPPLSLSRLTLVQLLRCCIPNLPKTQTKTYTKNPLLNAAYFLACSLNSLKKLTYKTSLEDRLREWRNIGNENFRSTCRSLSFIVWPGCGLSDGSITVTVSVTVPCILSAGVLLPKGFVNSSGLVNVIWNKI